MYVWELRLDPIYADQPAGSAAGKPPDISYVPFPPRWEISGQTSVPIFKHVPYFNGNGFHHGENMFVREAWNGFPFVNPDEISIRDLAQAGVVYEQLVRERKQNEFLESRTWEFSMEFHERFIEEMEKYAVTHEAGDLVPKLILSRGPKD